MDIEFNSLRELYERVTPALNSKVKELKRNNIDHVKCEDIWNYLIESKWKLGKDLKLHNIVDDILNTNNDDIIHYVNNKMKEMKRNINFDNDML